MRNWITLFMTCLVVGSYANANTGQVNLEAGYRRDNITWKQHFPSSFDAAKSEKFKDLDIFQIGIDGRTTLGCNFYARGNAYWGWILDGNYRRRSTFEFSQYSGSGFNRFNDHNNSVINDKYVYGVAAAIGYPFYFCDCTTIIAPVIGYSFDEQSVEFENTFRNRNDFCNESSYGSDSEDCCRQTFHSRWYGPFVGVDFNYRPNNDCWNFFADVEFHWGHFRGRKNLCCFDQFGDGKHSSHRSRGWVFAAGAEYDLCNCWTAGISVKFQDYSANRRSRIRDSYYCESTCFKQRTNHKWHSYAINLTLGKSF